MQTPRVEALGIEIEHCHFWVIDKLESYAKGADPNPVSNMELL